jgi:hypothetical protein
LHSGGWHVGKDALFGNLANKHFLFNFCGKNRKCAKSGHLKQIFQQALAKKVYNEQFCTWWQNIESIVQVAAEIHTAKFGRTALSSSWA